MKMMSPTIPTLRGIATLTAVGLAVACSSDGRDTTASVYDLSPTSANSHMVKIESHREMEHVEQARDRNPEPRAQELRGGDIRFSLPQLPESAPDLFSREAMLDDGELETDHFSQGEAHMAHGELEDAVLSFRKALSSNRDNPEVWFKLGRAYSRVGKKTRGMDCLEEALQYKSDHAGAYATLIRMLLDSGENQVALSYAHTLRNIEPSAFRSAFLLGRSYARQKMWKESIESFEAALEVRPEHLWANNNLGWSALQIGEFEMAAYALEVATGAEGAKPFMFNSLGLAYEKLGEPIHAMVAYDAALEMQSKHVKASLNRARMMASLTPEQEEEYAAFQLELPPLDTESVEENPVRTAASLGDTGGGQSVGAPRANFITSPMDSALPR